MLIRACLAAAVAVLALAPAARAGVSWVVKGHGFGHGVGMSQYGAFGYAKHGKGYRFILRHYYSGTKIGKLAGPRLVRVLVDISGGDVGFSGATSACGKRLARERSYEARRVGSSLRLRSAGGRALASCGRKLRATGNGRVRIEGAAYRGALEVVPTGSDAGSLNAVNAVPVDQYVKGVIPNESPASWPMAALRAQAVAARSYALATRVDGNGFDLYNDTRSQVYEGIASEAVRTNRAANATGGQVVRYRGRIAQTFFSACSGGHTESVQNVFFGPAIPYLVGVPDPYDHHCPLHRWKLRFSGRQINAKLDGYLKGRLRRVVVTKRGASPRIVWARLHGTGGVTKIRGDRLASALGAYDRWMTFRKFVNGKAVGGGDTETGGVAK
ncbi:MAG: SpoIID/LytB domain-containing protein [Solirubrobacterales bacterium]|nr:SpoIID/LytB domain-containing protein [Solirubrobacterales bacterium]